MAEIRDISKRIVMWNDERGLLKTPEHVNLEIEMSFITEELLEMCTGLKSSEARTKALALAALINDPEHEQTPEQVVDAAGDIIVFATGLIRKMGYCPEEAMHEVLKEIESRGGSIIDGKFTKDKSPEAQAKWYKANFGNAEIPKQNV